MHAPARWLGFFGKLPAQADFVGRGLPAEVQVVFDQVMSQWLVERREADAGWLQAYLASPAWRFVWPAGSAPGALAEQDCAGVLLPSVDAVGRYFPLLLAVGLPAGSLPAQPLGQLMESLAALELLGFSALDEEWQPDVLHAAMTQAPVAGWPLAPDMEVDADGADRADRAAAVVARAPGDLSAELDAQARQLWLQAQAGRALWWTQPEAWQPCLLHSQGPLAEGLSSRLLGLQGLAAAAPLSSTP